MSLELLFLGTGTSAGVPMIGCNCEVCTSTDPRDTRSRASALVRWTDPNDGDAPPRQVLIDTAPEMRQQVIRHDIQHIDGVFYTHTHADHIFGLDDLRRFNAVMDKSIDVWAEPSALESLRRMFVYIFEPARNVNKSFVATLLAHAIEPGESVELHGATWSAVRLLHGRLPILGFRVDLGEGASRQSLAYCTDISTLPPESYPQLEGLDVLVVDALRYRHHPTHMTVEQALALIEQLRPRRAYLTHIAHDIRHADLEANLPEHVFLSFDGLTVKART